ncbi:MAG TPA: HlyD family secretion protein [Aliidongia sp.]|nr:HlyD family secretion protein [Aliidongia sp.]
MTELTGPQETPAAAAAPGPSQRFRAARILPPLLTLVMLAAAGVLAWAMWHAYMGTPWTRDGTVRAYVIRQTPEVSGRIVNLPVIADQYVHKGDLLMEIDPTDYQIAVDNAEAVVAQAKANVANKKTEASRRLQLNSLAVSQEEQQTFVSQAQIAEGAYNQDLALLAQAKTNLARTRIVSPVNGHVTNLTVQVGDYAVAGQRALSIVNTDSFWIEGYFEEDVLDTIHIGAPARASLMGRKGVLTGHVIGIARGIEVANAQSDPAGLATVNPIFTWIRLAQRVPVRIAIDHAPPDVTLVVGLTATVEILPPTATKPSPEPTR